MTTLNLSNLLEDSARKYPDRDALVLGPTRLTYRQVDAAANQIEVEARLAAKGTRSRTVDFELRIICRSVDETGRAEVLAEPIVATRARGTGVIPADVANNGS